MKVLINTDLSNKQTFEVDRLRKNFKGALEMQNEMYSTHFKASFCSVAQFFSLNEVSMFELEKKDRTVKYVIALLFQEDDSAGEIILKQSMNKTQYSYAIPTNFINMINAYDAVIAPSLEAKKYLIGSGITVPVYVYNGGIKMTKFDLRKSLTKNICYRYLGFNEGTKLMTTVLKHDDFEAFDRVIELAKRFPNFKIIALTQNLNKKIKKMGKKLPSNVLLTQLLENDVYCSAMYNAEVFVNLGSSYGAIIQTYEAMASFTQVFSLYQSTFSDITIDKKTGYVYNDFASLLNGIDSFLNKSLPSLVEAEFEYVSKFSIQNSGKQLISIYKEIGGNIV
jgi:glycosyltransferase involved in cell wall biosynthesis